MEVGLLLSFSTGLMGGFGHCIGMCGPILSSFSMAAAGESTTASLLHHSFFHAGRIAGYALIGGIMGFTGSFVNVTGKMAGMQNLAMTLAGLFMIIMGIGITGLVPAILRFLESQNGFILNSAKPLFRWESRWKFFPLGFVLSFMPCGLSYTAFIWAAGTGSWLAGMGTTLAFGLGTVFPLLLVGMAVRLFSSRLRGALFKIGGILIIIMGCYYVMTSLKLYAEM